MTKKLLVSSPGVKALVALALSLAPGQAWSAAGYSGSTTSSRATAQRRAGAGAQQQRSNFIGNTHIPVATKPSTQIPVATKPQTQIPYQKTPAPSVVTPPTTKLSGIYQPTTVTGFYPVMKTNQAVAKKQAITGDRRKPMDWRVNLHPDRSWQGETTGTAAAFRKNYRPTPLLLRGR